MKYILKTTYPCLVKAKDEECEMDENDTLEIVDEKIIYIYPTCARAIPFYINLNSPKESEFYSLFPHKKDTLILLENTSNLRVSQKEVLSFGSKKCEVSVCNDSISFENDNKKIKYFCPHECGEHKILKINDYACVQFDNDFYAYSVKKNRLSHLHGQAEIDGEIVTLSKDFHDSETRERHAKYKFGEDIIMEEENFSRNANQINKDLAPYKLMESVKARDFEFAHSLLSENLKSQIDAAQIKEFFGNFTSFLPLSTTEFITISGKQKNYVKFNLHENLIDDITVDAL